MHLPALPYASKFSPFGRSVTYSCSDVHVCLLLCSGQDPAAPSPTEAATNTKHTSDLLRRFKELRVREGKDLAALDQPEIDLKVSHKVRGMHLAYHPVLCLACVESNTSMASNTVSHCVILC